MPRTTDPNAGRQPCEIYSRVVGYLRPIQQWNVGKRAERRQHVSYQVGLNGTPAATRPERSAGEGEQREKGATTLSTSPVVACSAPIRGSGDGPGDAPPPLPAASSGQDEGS